MHAETQRRGGAGIFWKDAVPLKRAQSRNRLTCSALPRLRVQPFLHGADKYLKTGTAGNQRGAEGTIGAGDGLFSMI